MSESNSNVEKLLSAILYNDSSYLVVPQSRVEELLLAIYKNGGGGSHSELTRAEVEEMLTHKVSVKNGYDLISTEEIERLSQVENYDDKKILEEIGKKVSKENGYSLILVEDYDRFKLLENYDDTELVERISKLEGEVVPAERKIAGMSLEEDITTQKLSDAIIPSYTKAEFEEIKDDIPVGQKFIIIDD